MEKYLAIILLSAPGFISKFVAQCLGDTPPKRGEFESVLVYSSFSLFAITLTLLLAAGFGMYDPATDWINLESKFKSPIFCVKFLALSVFCSVIVGGTWHLWIEKFLVWIFNKVNVKTGGNEVFLEGMLLHKMLNDGDDHFLVVEKDNKEIIAGFFRAVSSPCSDRIELSVNSYPLYKEWLEAAKLDPTIVLNNIKGVYLDLTSGTIIRELEYPPEFLTSKAQVEQVVAEAAATDD